MANVTQGIVVELKQGHLVVKSTVRASRSGICRYKPQDDVIEQKQGVLVIDDSALVEGDYVVIIMTAKNATSGQVVREKTTAIYPANVAVVEGNSVTLPSGTVVGKDSGVAVV